MRTFRIVLCIVVLSLLATACDLAPPGEETGEPPVTPSESEQPGASEPGEPPEDEPPAGGGDAVALELPFPCGQEWRLDTWGHAPALDMVREPDQKGTEGAVLVAPADGVVNASTRHDNAGNMIQIDHGNGQFTTYLHLESRSVDVGDEVTQGQEIGRVGRDGPTANNHPHLHFEYAVDANGDGRASWGTADSERVPPTFGGVEYGQANNKTWRNVASNNSC